MMVVLWFENIRFDFCIEGLCQGIGRSVVVEVQNFLIMLVEGGCDNIEGMESGFFHLIVPACLGQACGILDCVFGKDHPQ